MKSQGISKVTTWNLKQTLKIHVEEDFSYQAGRKYLDELEMRDEIEYVSKYISENALRWSSWGRRHK